MLKDWVNKNRCALVAMACCTAMTMASMARAEVGAAGEPSEPGESTAMANHPCAPKHKAKHKAKKDLRMCLSGWSQRRPSSEQPSDDCTMKTKAFVTAAKDLNACSMQHAKGQ